LRVTRSCDRRGLAFFFALTLALATVLPSQPPVAGIAVGVAIAPGILGSFVPGFADLLPPTMGPWAVAAAMGQPVSMVTPIAGQSVRRRRRRCRHRAHPEA
jgi:hypothetical protein